MYYVNYYNQDFEFQSLGFFSLADAREFSKSVFCLNSIKDMNGERYDC